jgi:hypothetical protein
MGRADTKSILDGKCDSHNRITFTSAAGVPSGRLGIASVADVSVMDLIDETLWAAKTSPGASTFRDASARYKPMNTGALTLVIARRQGFSVLPPLAMCAACDTVVASRGDHATSFYSSGTVSRGLRHGSLMQWLCGALRDASMRNEPHKYG